MIVEVFLTAVCAFLFCGLLGFGAFYFFVFKRTGQIKRDRCYVISKKFRALR